MAWPRTQSPLARTPGSEEMRIGAFHPQEQTGYTMGRAERARAQQRRFVSDASHELLTPMAGLRAKLEEARMHPEDTDFEELLGQALDDVARLQAITNDLLLLAKLDDGASDTLEEVNLAKLVRTQVSQRVDRVPMELRLPPSLIVNAVRDQLVCVLSHLLDNAQRHAESLVRVELRSDEESAELIVIDDGKGIAEPEREQIFECFTRLDTARSRDRGGAGLGLAIVRGMAHFHHGTIRVEGSETGGARFVLRLPKAGNGPGAGSATPGTPAQGCVAMA